MDMVWENNCKQNGGAPQWDRAEPACIEGSCVIASGYFELENWKPIFIADIMTKENATIAEMVEGVPATLKMEIVR